MPKLAVNTVTIKPADLATKVAATAAAGFTGIEPWFYDFDPYVSRGDLGEARRIISDAGLDLPAICGGGEWIAAGDAELQPLLDAFRRKLDLVAELGCPVTLAATWGAKASRAVIADCFARLYEEGRQRGVTVALEFLGFSDLCDNVPTSLDILQRAGIDRDGLLIDLYHLYRGGGDLQDLDRVTPRQLVHVHYDDAPQPILEVGDPDRVMPGEGCLPVGEFLRKVDAMGYQGYCSLELFSEAQWHEDPTTVLRRGYLQTMECLQAADA